MVAFSCAIMLVATRSQFHRFKGMVGDSDAVLYGRLVIFCLWCLETSTHTHTHTHGHTCT